MSKYSILCLSPHPDDVELSMYGFISTRHLTDVDIVCCSIGGRLDPSSSPQRQDEVRRVWDNQYHVKVMCEPGAVTDRDEGAWIQFLEAKYDIVGYDWIYVPPFEDDHYEHRTINMVGRALVRKLPIGLVEYRTISTTQAWQPNTFFRIDLEKKIQALQSFDSQLAKPYFSREVLNAMHTDVASLKRGVANVEQYRVVSAYL